MTSPWRLLQRNRLCCYTILTFACLTTNYYIFFRKPAIVIKEEEVIEVEDNNVVNPSQCILARLKPDNPEVTKFLKDVGKAIKCPQKRNSDVQPMAYIKDDQVFVNETDAKCIVKYFVHLPSDKTEIKEMPVADEGTTLPADYGQIVCSKGKQKWSTMFDEIQVDRKLVNFTRETNAKQPLNVVIFSFDSTSHMHALRKLPRSVEYFTNEMKGHILNGYNIVGDGTPQAFIPILTGKTEEELPSVRRVEKHGTFLDDVYPLIWTKYAERGAATAFGEDTPSTLMFTYRLRGFKAQPVTHYPRLYYQGAANVGVAKGYCTDGRPQHEMFLRSIRQVFTKYPKTVPKFMLMHHASYSHDSSDDIQMIDDDLRSFFEWMHTSGAMDNTLLIFMADHGHRFAKLRQTQQGMQEERLPLMAFAASKKWREGEGREAWQNLKTNVNRLTTPFDIYETLLDLLNWPPRKADLPKRGLSLWNEISEDRTCDEAGVEAHWCTCMQWAAVKPKHAKVIAVANALVDRINQETKEERSNCALLVLDKILTAKRQAVNAAALKYAGVKDLHGFVPKLVVGAVKVEHVDYQLTLTTKPGNALYEATIRVSTNTKEANPTPTITVDLNSVSHVNKYGDLPHCVIDRNYFLAKWCVCRDKI